MSNKKTTGFLLGAAAAVAAVWHLRNRILADIDLFIVLEPRNEGGCRVATKPNNTTARTNQKITWNITNNCPQDVRVSLEAWRTLGGSPICAAATPDNSDPSDPQPGLWKKVKANKQGKIKARARGPNNIFFGDECHYDVYLNDELGADPIVKLTL